MPRFRSAVIGVDLEEDGQFQLREPSDEFDEEERLWGLRRRKRHAELFGDDDLALPNAAEDDIKTFHRDGKVQENRQLAECIAGWDGEEEINEKTVNELPTVTRKRLLKEILDMRYTDEEQQAFLARLAMRSPAASESRPHLPGGLPPQGTTSIGGSPPNTDGSPGRPTGPPAPPRQPA